MQRVPTCDDGDKVETCTNHQRHGNSPPGLVFRASSSTTDDTNLTWWQLHVHSSPGWRMEVVSADVKDHELARHGLLVLGHHDAHQGSQVVSRCKTSPRKMPISS